MIDCESLELLARLACERVGVAVLPKSIAEAQANQPLVQMEPKLIYLDEICLVFRVENRNIAAVQAIKKVFIENKEGLQSKIMN